jgi:hypothetical protein
LLRVAGAVAGTGVLDTGVGYLLFAVVAEEGLLALAALFRVASAVAVAGSVLVVTIRVLLLAVRSFVPSFAFAAFSGIAHAVTVTGSVFQSAGLD